MDKPLVSVMFMSYNHAPYITEALDSVLAQTYENYEVLVSDDCSTDETKQILGSVKNEKVRIYFHEKNRGATFNNLFLKEASRGKYLALINSDDVWYPTHLEESVNYLEKHPECGAVFSWADLIDEESNVIDPCCEVFKQPNRTQAEWVNWLFTKGNCLCHPSLVIRKEVYEDIGFYKLGFRQLPDFNLWTRVVNKYDIYIIPKVLVHHRRCIKTGQNTSAPVIQNSIRDVNESLYTLLHYFDNMTDVLFYKAFLGEFRDKTANTREELMCERFFLMYDERYYMKGISRIGAFMYLQDIYDEIYEVLLEKYNFSLKDVHELGSLCDVAGLTRQGTILTNNTESVQTEKFIMKLIRCIKGGR